MKKLKGITIGIFLTITLIAGSFSILGFVVRIVFPAPSEHWAVEATRIRWVNDPIEVNKHLIDYEDIRNKEVMGLAEATPDQCVIYAYEPRGRFDENYLEALGHEVLHCFRGDFHK